MYRKLCTITCSVHKTGGSLASITEAKAGIMKESRPVVLGRQLHPEAKRILCHHADLLKCRCRQAALT